MSFESAKAQLTRHGLADRIRICEQSSATVELAAAALGCRPGNIAKTLAFLLEGAPLLIVVAGDARIDNQKYKAQFVKKASMIDSATVESLTGHPQGGVCPFGVNAGCKVYLDVSLKRYERIYPACGTANSAVELTLSELEEAAEPLGWIDVCKDPAP